MSVQEVRPELPPMPTRIERLPVDGRGYPVPWFVVWLDDAAERVEPGLGRPEFRVMDEVKLVEAVRFSRCWVCGGPLGANRAFVLGPMCAVNRTSAEPPSHRECADWSARACPFLTRPHMVRREAGMPEESVEPAGIMLRRNPGVALVWVTRNERAALAPRPDGSKGVLFNIGDPQEVVWYAEGRPATRAEILESIESGLPALRELAEAQGVIAVERLEKQTRIALELLPL